MSIENSNISNDTTDQIVYLQQENVPDYLKPTIDVEYIFTPGLYHSGNIENIPSDAIGVKIWQGFPYVAANGYIRPYLIKYNIYVGVSLDIEKALFAFYDECSQIDLNRLKKEGFKTVVIPVNSPVPIKEFIGLGENDIVVASNEELAETVAKINLIHKSMNPIISYPALSVQFPKNGYRRKKKKDETF